MYVQTTQTEAIRQRGQKQALCCGHQLDERGETESRAVLM